MNPIDQIRKALEALTTAEAGGMWGDIEYAREGFWNVVDRASVEALLASRDAAVQRAAEMQERCAQVCQAEIENWRSVWPGECGREVHALNVCIDSIRAIKE